MESDTSVNTIQHPKTPDTRSTAVRKRAFQAALRVTMNRSKAAIAAGIERTTHYHWVRTDPKYRAAIEQIEEHIGDTLEDEAIRRAFEGIQKPVSIGGEREMVTEYSDTLLIFALKRFKPEKYRERFDTRHSGANGEKLQLFDDFLVAAHKEHQKPE